MSDFNRMLYNSNKVSDTIKKVCDPLRSILGIQYFYYCETSDDGVIFTWANIPEMHEYFYATKSYLYSPFYRNPSLISPGFYSYDAIQDEKFQETIATSVRKHPLSYGGSIFVKYNSTLMRFGYAFDKSLGRKSTDIILNNLPVIKKFNNYFLNEMKSSLQKARNSGVYLPNELGKFYNQRPVGLGNILSTQQKCQFLEKIGYMNGNIKKLTSREVECLKYLHEGHNARETGECLSISSRTVEKHLESIKNKLSCFTKSDLANQAHSLTLAGIF